MYNNINITLLNRGETAKIIDCDMSALPAKYYELGFRPGATIKIQHKAPFKGPICIHIVDTNTLIAIRENEAQLIIAEKI